MNSGRLNLAQRLCLMPVYLYRITVGRFLGGHCRFTPTCSQYAIDAIHQYGAIKGSWKAIKRILRCRPFGGSGFDPA